MTDCGTVWKWNSACPDCPLVPERFGNGAGLGVLDAAVVAEGFGLRRPRRASSPDRW